MDEQRNEGDGPDLSGFRFEGGSPRIGETIDIPLIGGRSIEATVTKIVWRMGDDGAFRSSVHVDAANPEEAQRLRAELEAEGRLS